MGISQRKLEQWQQAGLMSTQQVAAILAFEQQHASRTNWWLYSIMILGVVIIGLGVISLIAANWANIPDTLKLGVDFAALALLALAIYGQYDQPNRAWLETLIAGFLLLCLASIGLIAQIFHTGGQWYHALLFWSVITFGITLFAHSLFTRFFWVTILLHSALWSINALYNTHEDHMLDGFPTLFLLAPLLCAALYYFTTHIHRLIGFSSSFLFWFQLTAIVSLVFVDVSRSGGELHNYQSEWYMPAYILAAVLATGIILHRDYKLLNKLLLLACLGLLLAYYQPDLLFNGYSRYSLFSSYSTDANLGFWQADDIRAPLLTLLILFLYALHAGNSGQQRAFNIATFLIGLRFVVLYFQAMGGLAATGIGLIISGILIMSIAWLWYKSREYFSQWTKGLAS